MKTLSAILMTALLSPCVGASSQPRPVLDKQGALLVYLQPFPQDAQRLRFHIDELAVLRDDGSMLRAKLTLSDLDGTKMSRQRRLGSVNLPPGRYSGLAITVSGATLQRQEGPTPLTFPEEAVTIPVPFEVRTRNALVLNLQLDYRRSVEDGFRFTPSFTAQPALRPPVARLGLVSSPQRDTVTFYDKLSGEVVGVLPTGREPTGMVLAATGRRAYVAVTGDDMVLAVGLLEQRILETLRLRGGDRPVGLALTPDGRTLLAADSGSRTVSVIDALSMVERDRITVEDQPRSILVDSSGSRAYTFNTAATSLTVVDIANRAVVGSIVTDGEPFRGQFNREGTVLYVIHRRSPFLTLIDPASLSVTRRVFLGSAATALRVDPRTDLIYLSPRGAGVVEVYDPISFLPVDSFRTEEDASFLALDGQENTLHVTLPGSRELRVFRLVGKKLIARAEVEEDLYWVALFGER